ncbi:MAG: ABC transporter substrate-binding protein [Solirubrobacterales bacterium]
MRIRLITISLLVVAIALAAAGCGSNSSSGSSDTIRLAYTDQISGGIDPATFYSVEGDDLILGVYETLLTYKPDSKELAPSLATSWDVSPDGMTYTFHLHDGVTFHDGTKMDSEAVKASFEREIAVKGGPSYMLAQVKSMETPDPLTFVVHLTQPVSAFLDYNASMYGPHIVSPTAVKEHTVGDDNATKWLSENEAGTGPYEISSYKPAGPFVLKAYPDYWGTPAKTENIEISVIPNIGDQILQLRSGQLDLVTHGIDPQQIQSLESDSNLQVQQFDAGIRPVLVLNLARPPFDADVAARQAFVADANLPAVAQQVYGDAADPVSTVVPPIVLPEDQDPLPDPGPPQKAPVSDQITIGYTNLETDLRRDAEVMQQSLEAQGWNVKLRADSVSAQFGYGTDPTKAPQAAITTLNPDEAHPAGWLNPIYSSEGGGLNLLGYDEPSTNAALNNALAQTNTDQSLADYAKVAGTVGKSWYVTGIADKHDVFAANSDVSGFTHVPVYIWVSQLSTLEKG